MSLGDHERLEKRPENARETADSYQFTPTAVLRVWFGRWAELGVALGPPAPPVAPRLKSTTICTDIQIQVPIYHINRCCIKNIKYFRNFYFASRITPTETKILEKFKKCHVRNMLLNRSDPTLLPIFSRFNGQNRARFLANFFGLYL